MGAHYSYVHCPLDLSPLFYMDDSPIWALRNVPTTLFVEMCNCTPLLRAHVTFVHMGAYVCAKSCTLGVLLCEGTPLVCVHVQDCNSFDVFCQHGSKPLGLCTYSTFLRRKEKKAKRCLAVKGKMRDTQLNPAHLPNSRSLKVSLFKKRFACAAQEKCADLASNAHLESCFRGCHGLSWMGCPCLTGINASLALFFV